MNRNIEKMFGIPLFSWEDWDETDSINEIILNNVEFVFPSMKSYNGMSVLMGFDGSLKIYNNEGEIVWSAYIIDIPEFREQITR